MIAKPEIVDAVLHATAQLFDEFGFVGLNTQRFVNVSGDLIREICLYPNKQDAYVWRGVFPLCQNDLWTGWSALGMRFPRKHGTLKIKSAQDLSGAMERLKGSAEQEVQFLLRLRDPADMSREIAKAPRPARQLANAYCLASLGKLDAAAKSAEVFVTEDPMSRGVKSAELLRQSIESGSVTEFLDRNRKTKVRKLKLTNLVAD